MMDESENIGSKNTSLNLIADYGSDSGSEDTETQSNTGNEDSDAVEHHEMVLKNNIINACAHGPLSKNENPRDNVEVTRHMIIDNMESGVVEYEVSEYRDIDFDSDSDSSSDPSISSDSDVDSVKDVEEVSSGDETEKKYVGKPETPKVHGELGLDDLPPIEDLSISLPAQQTTKIGTIISIVDRLVIVRAVPETPAVDIDTVLFLENGAKALGRVFDVFGPVTEPHYCVRFNSVEHVRARGVAPGIDVFVAPMTQHTNYVFLSRLLNTKGSDASWLNDVEPPPTQLEYSDDEEERKAIRARKERQKQLEEAENGETSINPPFRKTLEARRNQRPSESSSRFGSGPSRGRNPFSAGVKRNPNALPRFVRPWVNQPDLRTLPPPPRLGPPPVPALTPLHAPMTPIQAPVPSPVHPPAQSPVHAPVSAPANYGYSAPFSPSMIQPNFCTPPPPFMGNQFQFGMNSRMPPPPLPPMNVPPPFRQPAPSFGPPYRSAPQPQWLTGVPPPPPPGT